MSIVPAPAKTLIGNIGENHRYIKTLLKAKVDTIKKIQSAMDQKVRTKTPLSEGKQRNFNKFTSIYAQEGGKLQESLIHIESIQRDLHTENSQSLTLSLLLLQKHQHKAIKSLNQIITIGEEVLLGL